MAPCDPKCPPAAAMLPAEFARLLARIGTVESSALLAVFGPTGASMIKTREASAIDFIRMEFAAKWNSSSPDTVNDAGEYENTAATTSASAGVWGLLDSVHQRLFRDVAVSGEIYRPLGHVFHFTVPDSVYRFKVGLTGDNTSPLDAAVLDYATFQFTENQCREIYIFVPRSYGPDDTNTVHSANGDNYDGHFLNWASENDPITSAVTTWIVQQAYDVNGAQVAVSIQVESWAVFGTGPVLNNFVNKATETIRFENLAIGIS